LLIKALRWQSATCWPGSLSHLLRCFLPFFNGFSATSLPPARQGEVTGQDVPLLFPAKDLRSQPHTLIGADLLFVPRMLLAASAPK
jgi:hypothetical protein